MAQVSDNLAKLLQEGESRILQEWLADQKGSIVRRSRMTEDELRNQCAAILDLALTAVGKPDYGQTDVSTVADAQAVLRSLAEDWALRGLTPSEIARFVLSLKKPLFREIREAFKDRPAEMGAETWNVSLLLDSLALLGIEMHQETNEGVMRRQQQELLELSTPVVRLWDNVLALPLIGTLDSARTQIVMETLLEQIVATDSTTAIIDITGVPTVDTLVARHLLRTVEAARLMGAECIVSGIRPQIAQTIVHLGVDLNVTTRLSLADALELALDKQGLKVVPKAERA